MARPPVLPTPCKIPIVKLSGATWQRTPQPARDDEIPENRMRNARPALIVLAMAVLIATLGFVPRQGLGQGQTSAPYKAVPILLPALLNDASFDAFRQQLAEIAQKKDRAALARMVASSFFWVPDDADIADKNLTPIDNLTKALGLDDAIGWESLAAYAGEPTAGADPQRRGIFCAPAEPTYDEKAADELVEETQTDASDWAYPVRDGIEVRAAAASESPVLDKLGLYLVRILADDAAATAVLTFAKVLMPSGKVGFVPAEAVLPLGGEQLCYVKEPDGWKIAGFLGGESNP
jgi:hypothetical protein